MNSILSVDLVAAASRNEDLRDIPTDVIERDVRDYERFLALACANPTVPVAPTKAIDRIWHLHMLHPRAYIADTTAIFGEVLDHDGGFGSTPEEAPLLADCFARTARLWQATYGEPYSGAPRDVQVACKRNCVSRCQRRCKVGVREAKQLPIVIVGGECHEPKLERLRRETTRRLEWVPSSQADRVAQRVRHGDVGTVIILEGLIGHPLQDALRRAADAREVEVRFARKGGIASIRRALRGLA